jgi:hypothetical protein
VRCFGTDAKEAFAPSQTRCAKLCSVSQLGRVLIAIGVIVALVGAVMVAFGKLGVGRLPGDIVIERKNLKIYVPIVTSIVISIVLTLLANLLLRRR